MEIIKNRLCHFGRMKADTDLLEESQTVIVPDVRPDAMEILGAYGWLNVQEKGYVHNVLRINGQVNCVICYLSVEEQKPCTLSAAVPFNLVREIEGAGEEDRALSSVRLLNTTATMVNPRKLQVKVQLQVTERLYEKQTIEYVEEIKNGEEHGVQCLAVSQNICVVTDIVEKRLILNDEIRLSSRLPDEESILLRKESEWVTEDIKLLQGKIMVRGHIDMLLSSMSADGAFLGSGRYTIPFSQIIESDSVTSEDVIDLNYAPVREEVELVTDSDGITTMSFSFAAMVECMVKKYREVHAVRDVFSTRWEMRQEHSEICVPTENENHRFTTALKEEVLLDGCAAEILTASVVAEDVVFSHGEQTVGAGFYLWIAYKDPDGRVATACKKIYGEANGLKSMPGSGLCRITVKDVSAMLIGEDRVQFSFEAVFNCRECTGASWKLICACTVDTASRKEDTDRPSLILRHINKDETVWGLAKAYNTIPALLASANKLDSEEVIPAGRMILIPFTDR